MSISSLGKLVTLTKEEWEALKIVGMATVCDICTHEPKPKS